MSECCICFKKNIHVAAYDQTTCLGCLSKYNKEDDFLQLHPLKRTIMLKCKCGQVWNKHCAITGIMANAYTVDPNLFTLPLFLNATGEERRKMLMDPKYQIKVDHTEHGLVNLNK
jgi:hypothetical protein